MSSSGTGAGATGVVAVGETEGADGVVPQARLVAAKPARAARTVRAKTRLCVAAVFMTTR
jgi:hypothetical protein